MKFLKKGPNFFRPSEDSELRAVVVYSATIKF